MKWRVESENGQQKVLCKSDQQMAIATWILHTLKTFGGHISAKHFVDHF